MEDSPKEQVTEEQQNASADEDGTVLIYGHLLIKDLVSGEIIVSVRA